MPQPDRRKRTLRLSARARGLLGAAFAIACVGGAASWAASGCSGWDPANPFERNAPDVDHAIDELDAGRFESAADALTHYLGTGPCSEEGLGLPDSVRQKPDGSFDLGLALFHLAEKYGKRFGEEETETEGEGDPAVAAKRSQTIDCALVVVKAIAADPKVPTELRARARYLAGNLEFLRKKYEDAVKHYDQALQLVPGMEEEAGGDGIGRDASHNRSVALRRLQEKQDADPPDAEPDADPEDQQPDAGPDAEPNEPDAGDDGGEDEPDAGDDAGGDPEDGGEPDSGQDGGAPEDGGEDDGGAPPQPKEPEPQPSEAEPPPSATQDERMLDMLEEAPTYQEQEAKDRARGRRGRVMEDK